ncbi:hypothetical protein BLNAU_18825 [Blattamonas nauphoetae]|uniref:Uncharacterized protein n=1 Tax=Blattamonas nauphoetae TaxID=2049346 RepID=A0ABQ9X389_9EUKA|nr:hypothetical protein BLNAU_18825 [Blattamonas nauphoetae]
MDQRCPQPSPAPSDFSLDDLLQLKEKLKGYDPENGNRNEQLDEDKKRLDEMFQRLEQDKAKHDQIFKELDERNKQLDEKIKQERRDTANKVIIVSQSYTVNKLILLLREFSPNFEDHLKKPIKDYRFLQDGHIFSPRIG